MSAVLSIASQKGGVGKTLSAVNLAAMIALAGRKTVLVDLDPQGGATCALGLRREEAGDLSGCLSGGPVSVAPVQTAFGGLEVVPADRALADLEADLWREPEGFRKLEALARQLGKRFDLTIIDCPPGLGILTLNALATCDAAVVPVQCEPLSLEGLERVALAAGKMRAGSPLAALRFLLTFCEPSGIASATEAEARARFGSAVYETGIPRDVALVEAAKLGRPVMYHEGTARATRAYVELAREVLTHVHATD